MTKKMDENARTGLEIAIIGMAGRFPGAGNIDEYWDNLKNGVESISFFSKEELHGAGADPQLLDDPYFIGAKGVLENKACFDASFFNYIPGEAEIMNPQTRIFLECAFEALEDAGYDPGQYDGSIGLYAGAASSLHWEILTRVSGKSDEIGQYLATNLSDRDFINSRVANKLGLTGPTFVINTACSTSLVAIHVGCRALLIGECKMVLAGGIRVTTSPDQGYLYREGMIRSPDGHCRAFDAKAMGTVDGDGVGLVVLKRLQNAIDDGDHLYGIIKGSAINNDGGRSLGFEAPSVEGQAEAIRKAQRIARVEPETIRYIETHGTGTALGDPVEIEALKLAFGTNKKRFCAIGSVKTNIGHLDTAAGVAGLIKTVLALKHKRIPPSLHFNTPNPGIDFENTPFYVNSELNEWKNCEGPLRAGVSSFGIGGTNAHVVLEEAPQIGDSSGSRKFQVILLSGKTETARDRETGNLAKHLQKNPGINLPDVAYTLKTGRKHFDYRRMVMCSHVEEAIAALSSLDPSRVNSFFTRDDNRPVVFMFPGQGAQYADMALDLYRTEPVYREEMDRCLNILAPLMEDDIKQVDPVKIDQTRIAQPLLLATEYSLAKLLMNWGITPGAMIGHSIGEYTAACIAGVFSIEDALKLSVIRGRLMQEMPPGSMAGVPLSREQLEPVLESHKNISLAAVNSPSHCVVSGPHDAVADLARQLKEMGVDCRTLHTSHAFHSQMMTPVMENFIKVIERIALDKPGISYMSNLTGKWISGEETRDPAYWAAHLRKTVLFSDGIKELLKIEGAVFLEVGPGKALSTFFRQHTNTDSNRWAVNLMRHPREEIADSEYLLRKIGQLWLYGVKIGWDQFYRDERRLRVALPTYPFEKHRYWIEDNLLDGGTHILPQKPRLSKMTDVADFFYAPLWKQSMLDEGTAGGNPAERTFLVFLDPSGFGVRWAEQLRDEGYEVITVEKGGEFRETGKGEFTLNPANAGDYRALIHELSRAGAVPAFILHLWSITGKDGIPVPDIDTFDTAQNPGFYSLVYLARAAAGENITHDLHITAVSDNLRDVTGEEPLSPGKSTVLGAVKVIPQEFPNIRCRSIDILLPPPGSRREDELIRLLSAEVSTPSNDTIVAYRNNRRWVQIFEAVRLVPDEKRSSKRPLRRGGVYLVTGGLGKIGLLFAEFLVEAAGARVILTGRSAFPDRREWDRRLTGLRPSDAVGQTIRRIKALEEKGGKVMVFSADTADAVRMREVVAQAEKSFGPVNGVLHAAGVTRDNANQCAIEDTSEAVGNLQFRSKVHGLLVLDEIFKDRELDFCLLTSSLASILGGLGFAAYSAANIFMDTFVKWRSRYNSSRWISVNWDGWQPGETGDENPGELLITPAEGKTAFDRIITLWKENQVVVSTGDLHARLDRWIKMEPPAEADDPEGKEESRMSDRPAVTTAYAAPRSELERAIARIWKQFFGFRQIGIDDDFFELGGDSLKIMGVSAKIHKELQVEIPIKTFFNNPTIRKLARYLTGAGGKNFFAIEPVEQKEYYPLFSAQKRLYFLQKMEIESTAYNIPHMLLLEGKVNPGMLKRAFTKIIKRHESLRTSFLGINEVPVQFIHSEVEFEIEHYEVNPGLPLSSGPAGETVKRFIRPFDLSQAPLLRVGLLKTGESRHILMVDMHHIISDGLSTGNFIKELTTFYTGQEPLTLRIQYKDYAEWKVREKGNEKIKKQEEFWLTKFAGKIPVLNLPVDFKRPPVQSFAGDIVKFEIGGKETAGLKELAAREKVTLFMLLTAIYNILLAKICRQPEIVVGTVVAGRRHQNLEPLIGMFVNTLALKIHVDPDDIFVNFLQETKRTILEAFDNQEYPFDDLVEKVALDRDISRNPLFDVMFILQNLENESLELPGLKLTPLPMEHTTSKFDFNFISHESGESLKFEVEYSTTLFKRETIDRFILYFRNIISAVIDQPGMTVSKIKRSSETREEKRNAILTRYSKSLEIE